ncbi:NAD-dependent epimerase/dehydratase family protein [Novosphingobium sp. JCM 18896]|uniref:NAD-dependent epimerase/dehydratase family protein n=1 Tax=Novosphingobium sp. JCM 18896 TaxID=2989731 RepID=UPI002221798C|nr:NAD(P)-dependent oxidoreductase [Novosphingobium sp. JCM 18896]MCW1430539.1 NAD(P)-dependent oxidoreductase [Novosphingobium sp. JCM 18896]
MTIAVTGGTGFVGQALIEQARAQGVVVQALARKPQERRNGVDWIKGDLGDRRALAKLVEGVEAVIHVAGLTTAHSPAEFEEANVAGTLAVIEAAHAAGVQRLIFVSSLSAREPGLSAYGASKARAERVVKASGLDWTIVRPPTVYGPRDKDVFELFRSAKWGVIPTPKEGRSSLIHVDDLARLLLALVPGGEGVSHMNFEPDDGKRGGWSHYELARMIGWSVGRRPKVLGLSKRTMEWAAKADRMLRGAKAKLTLDRVGYMTHPDWVVSLGARVPAALWRPRVETREGMKATAQWYRKEGWL